MQPIEVRQQVLHAYARALSFPWIICAPLLGVAFLASLIIKHYTFKRGATVAAVTSKKKANKDGDVVETVVADPSEEKEQVNDNGEDDQDRDARKAPERIDSALTETSTITKDLELELESSDRDRRVLRDAERGGGPVA